MAAFGSFAGLASAGVGALCSYEANALNMFDFTPAPLSAAQQQQQQAHAAATPSSSAHHDISRIGGTMANYLLDAARARASGSGGCGSNGQISTTALDVLTIWPC